MLAEVLRTDVHRLHGDRGGRAGPSSRLTSVISDDHGELELTFFGKPQVIDYWRRQLQPGGPRHLRGEGRRVPRQQTADPSGLRHPRRRRRDRRRREAQRGARRGHPAAADRALSGDQQAADLDDRAVGRVGPRPADRAARPLAARRPAAGRGDRAGGRPSARSTSRRPPARSTAVGPAAVRGGVRAAADHGPAACGCQGARGRSTGARRRRTARRVRRAAAVHPHRGSGRGERARSMAELARAQPDAAAAPGRGRLRQDGRRAAGDAARWSTPAVRPPCWRRPRCSPPQHYQTDHRAARRPRRRWHARRRRARDGSCC